MKTHKANKYSSRKTDTGDGIFDSKKEANRFGELKMLEKSKLITLLSTQPKFVLQEEFEYQGEIIKEIAYIADFVYFDKELKVYVVEDVKGFRTEIYKIKRKIFLYSRHCVQDDTLVMDVNDAFPNEVFIFREY